MAGGRLRYPIFFTYSALLLLGNSLLDVEASRCQHVIHKKVGDTVEFSSCLSTEGVTMALWEYGGFIIADKDGDVAGKHQFTGRLDVNPTNFSLTVRRLTLQDSGDFKFVSEANDKQRDTVTITLQVHEPITKEPTIISSSTWHTLNESCTVLLECNATTDSSVSYNWTVRNQIISGSRLQYIIKRQDGDTKFTCTLSNFVSEMSTIKTVQCNNITSGTPEMVSSSSSLVPWIIGPVIGILLIILPLILLLFYTRSKDPCCKRVTQSQTVNKDAPQQQVYSSLLHGDGSVYETIRGSADAGTGDECTYEN
ncbi:signaling lymphocytic activation molecule-like [Sebastes umbrosus]|uniref:signaling lymphocytic activation molecule-like n=1 Tax=Sebastes umbrosus TaxID=72105 RepID=UPI00189F3A61|nr:signaling lymphocytic activation molecule-like [Sebastes umbrosus]